MSLFESSLAVEMSDSFHMSRLLVLIDAFTGEELTGSVQGITKLAKLDFLLRYPANLERALTARGVNRHLAAVRDFEKNNVESAMVRFRYGPWDFRYRRFLNLLVARGLVHLHVAGRTVHISATQRGHSIAEELGRSDDFSDLKMRTRLLKTHFDLGGTNLMRFIYATFPELANLRYGASINEV
jgi:hypothetical protein